MKKKKKSIWQTLLNGLLICAAAFVWVGLPIMIAASPNGYY